MKTGSLLARLMVGALWLAASMGAVASEGNRLPITGAFSSYQMPVRSIEDEFPRLSQTSIFRSFRTPPALAYFQGRLSVAVESLPVGALSSSTSGVVTSSIAPLPNLCVLSPWVTLMESGTSLRLNSSGFNLRLA